MPYPIPYPPQGLFLPPRGATLVVAASNATAKSKAQADHVCTGVKDEETLQRAHDELLALGTLYGIGKGSIKLSEGKFKLSGRVNSNPKVSWIGSGMQSTQIAGTGYTQYDAMDALSTWAALRGDETVALETTIKMEGTGSIKVTGSTTDYPGMKKTGLSSLDWSAKDSIELCIYLVAIFSTLPSTFRLTIKDSAGNYSYYDQPVYVPAKWFRVLFDLKNPAGTSGTLDLTDVAEIDIEARTTTNNFVFYVDDIGFDIIGFKVKYANVSGEFGCTFSDMMLGGVAAEDRLGIGIDIDGVQMATIKDVMGFYCRTTNVRAAKDTYFCKIDHCDFYDYYYGSGVQGVHVSSGNPLLQVVDCQFHGGGNNFAIIHPFWVSRCYFEIYGGTCTWVVVAGSTWLDNNIFVGGGQEQVIVITGGKLKSTSNWYYGGTVCVKFVGRGDDSTFIGDEFSDWTTNALDLGTSVRVKINAFFNNTLNTGTPFIIANTIYSYYLIEGCQFRSAAPTNATVFYNPASYVDCMIGCRSLNSNLPVYIGYLKDCFFDGGNAAVVLGGAATGRVTGCHIFTMAAGITVFAGLVEGNEIGGITGTAITIEANDISVQNNKIANCGTGIRTGAGRTGIVIKNNYLRNCATPFNLASIPLEMYRQQSDMFMDVLAVSATHVRSNEDLSAALPIVFTIDAQPDVPRTLSGHFDAHAQITAYSMTIVGVDARGLAVTEVKTEADGWDWETSNAFATITSITMTARTGTGVGDTMDIGITDVLGLSNFIYQTSDVYKIKKNNANAVVAAAQVNATYDTYDMAVIGLAVGDDFTIWFRSNLNVVA